MWDIWGAIIPPFNILLAGHLKKRLVQTKRELDDIMTTSKKSNTVTTAGVKPKKRWNLFPRINKTHDHHEDDHGGVLLNGWELLATMVTPFNLVLVANLKEKLGQTKRELEFIKKLKQGPELCPVPLFP